MTGLRRFALVLSNTARDRPIGSLVARRAFAGVGTILVASILVFAATQVLPGNAAVAVLGRTANPARLRAVEMQLHLDRGLVTQYWSWLTGVVTLHLGSSLANGAPVSAIVGPRLLNSAALVAAAGALGTMLGVGLGALAAIRRDSLADHVLSTAALAVTALPEFVVAIGLIILFSTIVLHLLPAVSLLPPGSYAWQDPSAMVLPVGTLVLVITPYIFRMMRAAMIEALESEYVEMARLKGMPDLRVVVIHAMPNAVAPTIQVIGLNLLYLAGGIVVVEYVFNFPGIGQGLVNAVADRDVPVIQFTVVALAAFYVAVNIASDVLALLASPRRRFARSGG